MGKQTEKNRCRGVTLIEIMVVVAIFAIMMVIMVLNMRNPQGSTSSNSLAQIVARELQSARFRALSSQHPVAVAFPSAGGIRPHSQSLYILEGWPTATTVQVHNYRGDIPSGYIFIGEWASADLITLAPLRNEPSAFNISSWLSPSTKDYVVAFAPDGSVVTNDLPWFNGELRIVVCAGANYGDGATPSGTLLGGGSTVNYFQLASPIYQPHTVCVSPMGSVSICPGLKGNDGSIALESGTFLSSVPPAAAAILSGQTNLGPAIQSVSVTPCNNTGTPASCDTTIKSDSFITLVVRATDPNPGDQLSCNVSCSFADGTAGSPGHFSGPPGGSRMRFDPNDTNTTLYPNGCWKATWVWAPSPNFAAKWAPPGAKISAICNVTDDHGLSTTNVLDHGVSVINFQVLNQGHIFFSAIYGGIPCLFSMGHDGSAPTPINPGSINHIASPMVSPDGSKIVYISKGGIFVCNSDGSGIVSVLNATTASGLTLASPTWSADGTQILFAGTSGGTQLYMVAASGATNTSLTSPLISPVPAPSAPFICGSNCQPRWSFADTANPQGQVTVVDSSGTPWVGNVGSPPGYALNLSTPINATLANCAWSSWNPSGNVIFKDASGNICANATGGYSTVIAGAATLPGNLYTPGSFSPDGSLAVFAQGSGVNSFGTFAACSAPFLSNWKKFSPLYGGIYGVGSPSWGSQ